MTLFNTNPKPPTEYERGVLGALMDCDLEGGATSAQVAEVIGKSPTSVGQALHRLMCKGRVQRIAGDRPSATPAKWTVVKL